MRIKKSLTALIVLCAVILTAAFSWKTAVPAHAAATYIVNGVQLPLQEKGYKTGDYRGAGLCWQFARHIYYSIWNCFFYPEGWGDDDMLRNYPSGEERRISAETARLFISAAPVGSVIRLQAVIEGSDTVKCNRHSLILLDKTETGCTLYHDWSGYASIDTLTWDEFEYKFRRDIDFGYFKYIKYPGARALNYDYDSDSLTKEMVISTRLAGVAELTEISHK